MLRRLWMLPLAAMLLSACTMRALIGVEVNADESGVFEVTLAFDEELRTLLEEDSPEPIDWTDPASFEGEGSPADLLDELPEGAEITPYSEEDFEGFTVTAQFSSLEELEEILADMSPEGDDAFPLTVTSEDGTRFELSTEGDLFGDARPSEEETDFIPASALADLFDFQLHVQLPGEVISTNADETTSDSVMVWRLDVMDEDPVQPGAVSEIGSSTPWLTLLLGAILVAALAGGFIFVRRRSGVPQPEPTV